MAVDEQQTPERTDAGKAHGGDRTASYRMKIGGMSCSFCT
jgi:hypothetical protein